MNKLVRRINSKWLAIYFWWIKEIYFFTPFDYGWRTYHIDKTEVSSSGFGNRPGSKIRRSYDHHSKLQLNPDLGSHLVRILQAGWWRRHCKLDWSEGRPSLGQSNSLSRYALYENGEPGIKSSRQLKVVKKGKEAVEQLGRWLMEGIQAMLVVPLNNIWWVLESFRQKLEP